MNLKAYQYVRSRLDFKKYPSMVLQHLAIDAVLVTACLYLLRTGDFAPYALSQVLLAGLFFRQFSLMHEAVHGTISDNRTLNSMVGLISGVLCFLPFESWRRLHLEHHAWTGNLEKDPSSKLRKDYDPTRRVKYAILSAIWRSWIPIMALLQQVVFWVYPIQQLKNPNYRVRTKVLIVLSVLIPIASYVLAMMLWPTVFHFKNFAPAFTLYLMMVELINFPHHMDVYAYRSQERMPVLEQHRVTRSSNYPSWFARHFLLNFNLHTEHHLFPSLPWYQLEQARDLIRPALGGAYQESQGNEWIVKNRKLKLSVLLPLPESTVAVTKPMPAAPIKKAA